MWSRSRFRFVLCALLLIGFIFNGIHSISSKEEALAQQMKIAEEMMRERTKVASAHRKMEQENEQFHEQDHKQRANHTSAKRRGLDEPSPDDEFANLYMEVSTYIDGIDNMDEIGNTPLINAILAGHYDATNNFIKAGANVNLPSKSGEYALVLAAERGLYHCTKALLEAKADPLLISQGENSKNLQGGKSALVVAIVIGHTEIIDLLLGSGADANQILPTSQSILMVASSTLSVPVNEHASIVQRLINAGADVNYRDANSSTALIFASSSGSAKVVNTLLVNGADVNAQNDEGSSALMFACTRGHIDAAYELLAAGADINAKDASGLSVLALVFEFAPDHKLRAILSLLVENGVDTQHFNVFSMVNKSSLEKRRDFLKARKRAQQEEEKTMKLKELEESAKKFGKWKKSNQVYGGG